MKKLKGDIAIAKKVLLIEAQAIRDVEKRISLSFGSSFITDHSKTSSPCSLKSCWILKFLCRSPRRELR